MPVLHIRDENGNFIPIRSIKGEDGKSAYEQAVEGGYEGTAEEFIATLNGLTNAEAIKHYNNYSNPHEVTPLQIGAMNAKPGYIELAPSSTAGNGGYIDFHYNGSGEDYTSRIFEDKEGHLNIIARNGVMLPSIDPTTKSVRNTYAGTTDIGAGSSLDTGCIYFVYE